MEGKIGLEARVRLSSLMTMRLFRFGRAESVYCAEKGREILIHL